MNMRNRGDIAHPCAGNENGRTGHEIWDIPISIIVLLLAHHPDHCELPFMDIRRRPWPKILRPKNHLDNASSIATRQITNLSWKLSSSRAAVSNQAVYDQGSKDVLFIPNFQPCHPWLSRRARPSSPCVHVTEIFPLKIYRPEHRLMLFIPARPTT